MKKLKLTHALRFSFAIKPVGVLMTAAFLAQGCATHGPLQPGQNGGGTDAAALNESSVDISYVLGHTHRRFIATAKAGSCTGQTWVDREILRESSIDRNRYAEFLERVEQFVNSPPRKPAEQPLPATGPGIPSGGTASELLSNTDESCRSPFVVTLKRGPNGNDTRAIQGCRGTDEGALSRLVRDGEFLLLKD